jgi:glucose 1-dehydrogenase
MKAITVEPKKLGTTRLEDVPEPDARDGSVLVETVAVGVCGTDVEIVEGKYGWAPPGKARLVTRRERPEDFERVLQRQAEDIKVVVQFAEA